MAKKVFGVNEWAKYSANCNIGCSNNCKYCYAKSSFIKKNPNGKWEEEKRNDKYFNYKWDKKDGTIMFPTNHDITPYNISDCLIYLRNILKAGNNVLIVSKPNFDCIKQICNEFKDYKKNILFRFSIGTLNDSIIENLEKGAPKIDERIKSLKYAKEKGFETSVSAEPLLDNTIEKAVELFYKLKPYATNSIWFGKMNHMSNIKDENITNIIKNQTDDNIKEIYKILKDEKLIKWKESYKKVLGLKIETKKGKDI